MPTNEDLLTQIDRLQDQLTQRVSFIGSLEKRIVELEGTVRAYEDLLQAQKNLIGFIQNWHEGGITITHRKIEALTKEDE